MRELTELLSSVRTTYATASRYCDSGRVHVTSGGGMDVESALFETTFERAGRILSLRYSSEREEAILLDVKGDDIEIKPLALKKLTRPNNLADAVAVLSGVTFSVAHNVFSLLLPEVLSGPSPCAEERDYRLTETPRAGRGLWIVETLTEPRKEVTIGPDLLLRGYNIRGIVPGVSDILIEYEPFIGTCSSCVERL